MKKLIENIITLAKLYAKVYEGQRLGWIVIKGHKNEMSWGSSEGMEIEVYTSGDTWEIIFGRIAIDNIDCAIKLPYDFTEEELLSTYEEALNYYDIVNANAVTQVTERVKELEEKIQELEQELLTLNVTK